MGKSWDKFFGYELSRAYRPIVYNIIVSLYTIRLAHS